MLKQLEAEQTVNDLIEFCKSLSFQDRTKEADKAIIDDLVNLRDFIERK